MDVILLERIEKLGQIGDVVSVKPGFARPPAAQEGLGATGQQEALRSSAQIEATNLKRKRPKIARRSTASDRRHPPGQERAGRFARSPAATSRTA
jgi:ribosomal protein L9